MKKIVDLFLLVLLFISFGFFAVNGYLVYEDYTSNPQESMIFNEGAYVSDKSCGQQTDQYGMDSIGTISILNMNSSYDTIFDDDDNNDSYYERRSYYNNGILVSASWDKNKDGDFDVYMNVKNGLNIDSVYQDVDYDGAFDTEYLFDTSGLALFIDNNISVNQGLKAATLMCIVGLIVFIILIIIRALSKKKMPKMLSTLMCCLIIINTNLPNVYADNLYDAEGSIVEEIFEKDWEKYSDIDDRIPFESRSYEAQQYENAKTNTNNYYNQLYTLVNAKEINRLEYLELVKTKEIIVKTHKSNLIKSFVRLSAFTAIQIKEAYGTGTSFADDILKEGANSVTQVGAIIEATSNYVTDEYEDGYSSTQKVFNFATSDNILKTIKDDVKSTITDKITDTLDDSELYYTVDDLKLSDEDFNILKSHYELNRTLDSSILKNRNKDLEFIKKIDDLNNKLINEISLMEKFLAEEKSRVHYLLSHQNSTEEYVVVEDQDSIGLLDADFSDVLDELTSDEHLENFTIEWDNNEEIPIEETVEYSMIGDWNGTQTVTDVTLISGDLTEDEKQIIFSSLMNKVFDNSLKIKELDGNVVALFGNNPDPYVMRIDGNNIVLSDYINYSDSDGSIAVDFTIQGYFNDEKNYISLTGIYDFEMSGPNGEKASLGLESIFDFKK
ncbi:MAG: hypothetical protein K8R73_05230 [Clostridiales bacterium]|nr:hypothetical protein [Clostridiales bacterium]